MSNRILVVDDDSEIRDVIHVYLRNEGFEVLEAADGRQALELLKTNEVGVIILDVMMPVLNGIQTCIRIRETSMTPIIMLSAKEEDIDKINGLSTGADDYVTKPFSPLELLARVKAQLRRQTFLAKDASSSSVLTAQELSVDKDRHAVTLSGRDIAVTPLEFAILELLLSHPGQVFSANRIYERVWNEPSGHSENTVMVHIRNLREKLEDDPRKPRYIKTVWGVGYKVEK
ncbi:response regulator transcription factor [Paenibacillus sp. FSL W8-1187]|uniref:Phosphate regulon transcriptional regulatory protein PhoB (SphR) n=1 Tax=Paenibacillus pasadenensis TaxID=217090 RepID=A0A2N5N3R8_9BACL|nr:response regulator transcription factor [Paenibacillus pasadenensis]PLT44994.1 Phosphate regulon transcriptional regulatory protein PhoB (SphR) [Paenibacillus pasadenensis]